MVNASEFRDRMSAVRQLADAEAEALKEPYIAIERLRDFYLRLNDEERQMGNTVIQDWLLSSDEKMRFDALVLVSSIRIRELIPALNQLMLMLNLMDGPGAKYERETVQHTIEKLTAPAAEN